MADEKLPELKKLKVTDLKQDKTNANKHTERGMALLSTSIQRNGMGRSILIDKNNNLIAGNATSITAEGLGIEDVIVVETNGKSIIAVKRNDIDLDTPEGRELALADNRVGEVNLKWNEEVLEKHFTQDMLNQYNIALSTKAQAPTTAKFPIVAQFDESYQAVIVVCKNETDWAFLQTVFGLQKSQSYKNTKVGTGAVIDVEQVRKQWQKIQESK